MSHSVHPETRELISTSVSAIQKFEDCPARWFHRYVLGEKEPFTGDQKAGVEGHAQAEHYLRTGEDVLGPTMRAGKHLLPAPNPLLRVEWGLNDKPKPPAGPDGKEIAYFPPEESLLQAAGVPLIGFMDFVNHTGVYTDPEGVIRDDPEGTIEVGDHKLTNDLKWAKPGASLIKTVQMAGYAEWCRQRFDGLTHVRLSHIYYKKKGAPAAKKETSIISLATVKERWYEVETLVEKMKDIARREENEITGNLNGCNLYPPDGCPFRNSCSTYKQTKPLERLSMSLLNRIKLQTNGTVPPPPASNGVAPVTPKRMVIQDESTTPDTVTLAAKDAEQGKLYVLPNGTAAKFTCGIGVGGNTFYSFSTGEGTTPLLLQANDRIKLVEAPKPIETPKPVEVVKLIEAPKAEPIAGKTEVAEEKKRGPGRPKKTDTIDAPVEHTSVAPSATAERGIRLYVNAIPNGPFTPLDGYVTGMLKTMHEEFEVLDIRCAPNANSPLAYAKWKGVLASLVRNAPPADGVYVAFTKGNEIAEVVVEALTGLCAPGALVRGVC